jgi:hypothetical protein
MPNLTEKEIIENNKIQEEKYDKEYCQFEINYEKNICYLCNKDFKTLSNEDPCIHSLLRMNKFKKKHMKKIYEKYGYFNISTFLKWCANKEVYMKNINNLKAEKSVKKIISYTIKWKNIEWTFDCAKNDLSGHAGTHSNFPHYHFQMKIDNRCFITFNQFHIPFSKEDLFVIDNEINNPQFIQSYGVNGLGMQEAMDLLKNNPTDNLIIGNDENSIYNNLTSITATDKDNPITGEEIMAIFKESEATGKTKSSLFHKRHKDKVNVKTIISPSDNIPDIASRTEHNKKS